MQVPGLGDAERQLAVRVRAQREEQAVARAVHRLQAEVALLDLEPEHVLLVLLPVAGRDPEVGVVELRRAHLLVAALSVLGAAEILEDVPDRHPARLPERHARRHLGEVEQVELLAQPAVVALLRLLDPLEVRVEVLLVEERRPVHAGQLLVLLVAAPVRARERRQLHGLDRRRVLEMRALAEVGELALAVERDVAFGRVHELDLVRLALGLEPRLRVVAGDLLARPLAALGDLAAHLLLEALEVGVGDRLGELEVVVEAVGDRRPDRDFRSREQSARGLGEEVRGRVAQHVERVGILPVARRQEVDRGAVRQRQTQVARLAVHLDQHRLLGQLRPDRARGVEPGRAVGQLELRSVGEDHLHSDGEY